ncbi:MAG: phage terminase large subunit [Candidatus Omnitrophica bacterium]|nr:phage terminase large subunit [Candidatus Omnitrophota bacterium]MDD5610946.1 phage terminase large subunit [Candidatus Omnitrophota bacterium]
MNNQEIDKLKACKERLSKIRKEVLSKDFLSFRRYYFPHYNKYPDSKMHRELSEILGKITTERGSKVAIAAPRGSAKSTLVSLQYVIYCICFKLEEFIVIVSHTQEQAANFLDDIKKEFETNPFLQQDFPSVCEFGSKLDPPRWTKKEILTSNKIKVIALGTGQQIRGRRNREFRPSLIILDDIESGDCFQNPQGQEHLFAWLTKSVLKSGSGKTNVVYVGTIHHYHSLLAQFTHPDLCPGWIKRIYHSVISWPVHQKLLEEWMSIYNYRSCFNGKTGPEAAREFYFAHKNEMLEGVEVLWPENEEMSFYHLMVKREQEGWVSFDSEMQNEPVNPKDCYFNIEEIHYWDDRFASEKELLSALESDGFEMCGACDPSLGKQSRNSDFSAIISVVRSKKDGSIYVVDADIQKRLPDKTIDDILAYQRIRKYSRFGFETNQFQEYMASVLEKRSSAEKTYLPLEEIKHSTDKLGRIQALQPLVKSGVIQFSKRHKILLEQMKFFPKADHDDGLDALEMVVKLCKDVGDGGVAAWILGDEIPKDGCWFPVVRFNAGC